MAAVTGGAVFTGQGSLAVTAYDGPDTAALWTFWETARQCAVKARCDWEESRAAGGTDGYAASLFAVYYRLEQAAEAAYLAWLAGLRQRSISEGTFAGYGGTPFISGAYPPYQQPPSVL